MKDVALILETNNLRGGSEDREKILHGLTRLFLHYKNQTLDIKTLKEIIVTHDGISETEKAKVIRTTELKNLKFLQISPLDNYYQAKELGFQASTAAIVVFADSDCVPVNEWLEKILLPFETQSAQVVSGRTTYDHSLFGIAATTIDFMYFGSVLNPTKTKNFYANNIAFRRELFDRYHFVPIEGQYRGQCQALGLKLLKDGVPIHFVSKAKTIHKFPDSFLELIQLRIFRGQDTVGLTPFLAKAYLPKSLLWLKNCGPVLPILILSIRFFASVFSIDRQDMPKVNFAQRIVVIAHILFINAFDFIGMLLGSVRKLLPFFKERENRTLSYHTESHNVSKTQIRSV
ncbi:glycosyltransferase [Leptospira barantonii]|uniref:Glycosyltransferase 2-like domain-containing protein n=1 Tax=Leptospira barantonii TaxID=2023184 RepID=A0ABX4NKD5_9LEPT|nr:glycosyltransferase [Leptospira barantonii]PJZ57275.1 hypothetical protein CH367_11125 [Leptospira barantonii]